MSKCGSSATGAEAPTMHPAQAGPSAQRRKWPMCKPGAEGLFRVFAPHPGFHRFGAVAACALRLWRVDTRPRRTRSRPTMATKMGLLRVGEVLEVLREFGGDPSRNPRLLDAPQNRSASTGDGVPHQDVAAVQPEGRFDPLETSKADPPSPLATEDWGGTARPPTHTRSAT